MTLSGRKRDRAGPSALLCKADIDLLTSGAFAHNHERRPVGRVRLAGLLLSIMASMARRRASARPAFGSWVIVPTAEVMSFAVAAESTDQCDTNRAGAPA